MPIINSYSAIVSGSGGSNINSVSSEQPYTYSFTGFVTIPANEKFLLIPGKEYAREIVLSFSSESVELYFGDSTIPFETLNSLEKYRDNQLGVDLWVKSIAECQCLVVIRSTEVIDYLGDIPTLPLITILDNGQKYIIDSSQVNPDELTGFYAYIDNPSLIPFPSAWDRFEAVVPDINWFNIEIDNGSNPSFYPTINNPFYWEFLITDNHEGYFQLTYNNGEDDISQKLSIKSYDETTRTFIVGM